MYNCYSNEIVVGWEMDFIKKKNYSILFLFFSLICFLIILVSGGEEIYSGSFLVKLVALFTVYIIYYLTDQFDFAKSRYSANMLVYTFIANILSLIIFIPIIGIKQSFLLFTIQFILFTLVKTAILSFFIKDNKILIIGKNYKSELIEKELKERQLYISIGIVEESKLKDKVEFLKLKEKIVKEKIGRVVITTDFVFEKNVTEGLLALKSNGVRIYDFLTFYEKIEEKVHVKSINENWFLLGQGFNILHSSFQKKVKRLVDIIMSLIIFIPALPIMLISVLIIKLESKGPIFFVQSRIGEGNRPFNIIKFRSMKLHDEKKHSKYAGTNDTRITTYGNFMRKSRIDELPQLFNVFKGEMSFVGPRAEWDKLCYSYMEQLPFYNLRHAIKPGLTGWAQVKYPYGASVEDALEKLQYDLYYIKHQSITMDIIIFFMTIKTVIFGKGR